MDRAYSLLEIKQIKDDQRIILGTATTPTPDRVGDVIEPLGVKFKNPLRLLWHHDSKLPVGEVNFKKPTKSGIDFEARLPFIEEDGPLKERVDTAWLEIKYKLVRAVSVGFRALEVSLMDDGGRRFIESECLELSLVTIPAQQDATIDVIKSIDAELLAASGHTQDGDNTSAGVTARKSNPVVKAKEAKRTMAKKTIAEQISAFEATRQAKAARMTEIMEASADEGVTLDAEQQQEYDGLSDEVKSIDAHLVRLADLQKASVAMAKAVDHADNSNRGSALRGGATYVKSPNLPKGTAFARYAMAVAAGRGSLSDTLAYAKRWDNQTPEVTQYIKAVAGSTDGGDGAASSGTWGGELVYPQNLPGEFIELLRPATIIGRITGIRNVPFNVRIAQQTGGSTVNWVGEAAAKPVSELDFSTVTLGYNKIAGIVILTEELVRLSSPSAEETVRRDLVEQIAKFMDEQFLDTSITASSTRPASITNGVSAVSSSGEDTDSLYFDLNTALAAFDSAELSDASVHLVMRRDLARGISALRNALGQFEFPGMNPGGGAVYGYPVIVSNSAPDNTIILINANEILMADDGRVTLDASREATLDMAGGDTPTFNLWQKNCIGIRAERFITWKKRRSSAVAMISSANYGPQGGSV